MNDIEDAGALDAEVSIAMVAAPPLPVPPVWREHGFEFSGRTGEYFRIWIVNLALGILTLGIYSAWAKVRTQRYFYSHTRLADTPFEYLAQPIPILKGRLIAVAFFGSYLLAGQFFPIAQLVLALMIGLATPWLVVRGLMFRARYSSWRGITFQFIADYSVAIRYFFLMYMLVPFTLGLIYPFIKFKQKQFMISNHRFGGKWFQMSATPGEFYVSYLAAAGLVIAWMFVVIMGGGALTTDLVRNNPDSAQVVVFSFVGLFYAGYFLVWVFLATRINNLVYNSVSLDGHRFVSSLRVWQMLGIYLSNTLAILCSAGLLIPWAMVRLARYRAAHLCLIAHDDLDRFSAEAARNEGAVGAEMDAFFDVDIGL